MKHDRFDSFTRLVSSGARRSRRATLAAVLGATLLGVEVEGLARRTKRRPRRVTAAAVRCYPGTNCTPGRGRNTSGCDFSFSAVLHNKTVRGANLSNSSFRGADLRGADFRGANLSGGCFVEADLSWAKLGRSVNLGGAIFCRTTMPNGTIDNSGCGQSTPCCDTCDPATCQSRGVSCGTVSDGCGGTLRCGTCGTGATPSCDDGVCARCDATCPVDCACFNLADGNTRCGSTLGSNCALACAADADCPASRPFCVASVTLRGLNETRTLATQCGQPGLVGACAEATSCG